MSYDSVRGARGAGQADSSPSEPTKYQKTSRLSPAPTITARLALILAMGDPCNPSLSDISRKDLRSRRMSPGKRA